MLDAAVKRAGIVLHGQKQTAADCGNTLAQELSRRGIEAFTLEADIPRMQENVSRATADEFERGFDIMFALGGDGTFLRAAALAAPSGTPLLGVNLGRLGFLAGVERDDLSAAVEAIARGDARIAERLALEATIEVSGQERARLWALNDISITKLAPGRMIKLALAIGDEPFTQISADGILVASPTGSTAYSFSAGGPIVAPGLDAIIVTAVAPHLIVDRSLVVSASTEVIIQILPDPDAVAVCADGHPHVDAPTDSVVRVRRSPHPLRVVEISGLPFWSLVQRKFGLPSPPDLPGMKPTTTA